MSKDYTITNIGTFEFPNYRFVSPSGQVLKLRVNNISRKFIYSTYSYGGRANRQHVKINVIKELAKHLCIEHRDTMENPTAYYLPTVRGKDRVKLFKKDPNTFVLNKLTIAYWDGKLPTWSEDVFDEVVELYKRKYTPQQIMDATHTSNWLVLKMIDRYNEYGYNY